MALSEADERRVEGEVLRMVIDLRFRPTQEKEDRIGLEIAAMTAEDRAFVPTALLRLMVMEREGREPEVEPLPPRFVPRSRPRRWYRPFR